MTDLGLPWERVFADTPVPLSIVDTQGRHVTCNRAFAELFGYTVDEVHQLEVELITRPQDRAWTSAYHERLVNGDLDRYETDKWYLHRDGTPFKARLHVLRSNDPAGGSDLLLAAILPPIGDPDRRPDETTAVRLLAMARESITLIDRSGEVRFSTGELVDIAGYPGSFWAGRDIREVLRHQNIDRVIGDRADFLDTPGAVLETEVEIDRGDGRRQLSSIRAVNCLDDALIDGFVVVSRDVTDERAHVAELAARRETAEAIAEAQTRLLATVSHELRNPLHAVHGLAEILARAELPPEAAELAGGLARQLSSLTHVTQDLLDAARLDAGQVEIVAEPIELAALVGDVTELGAAAARGKQLVVSARIDRGVPPWVMADGVRLRQVLGNLVGNAVKFTDVGSVETIVRPAGDEFVMFSVVDTGPGIPVDEQRTVLEAFAVGSNAGDHRGAGLGLSIVQRLVRAMNGRLTLSSTEGEGSRFDVVVPLGAARAPTTDRNEVDLPAGLRVLVVEDNPVNRQLARSQLDRLGVEAIVTDRGESALDLLRDPAYAPLDVVLMDEQLPGWSGSEATRHIRSHGGALADIPIIGLSASASAADRDAFLDAGMTDFVAKPASLADLAAALDRAVRRGAHRSGEPGGVDVRRAGRLPTLDTAVLDRLAAELGSVATVRDLAAMFSEALDERVGLIARGGDAAGRAAHTLGSTARLLGLSALAEVCDGVLSEGSGLDVARLADDARRALDQWVSEP